MKIHRVLAANSAIPGSIPLPALNASTLARMRGVTVPPPSPSQPRTQAACSGRPGEGEEKSALVSRGVVGQECPQQGTRPSLLRPASQTEGSKGREQSLASWHGRHRGVPAQVPVVEPGEEGQEGQEVTRGSPVSQGFLLLAFLKVQTLLPPNTRVQLSSAQLELSTSCRHQRHHHLITSTSTSIPELPLWKLP